MTLHDDRIHYGVAKVLLDEEGFWHVVFAEPDGLQTNFMISSSKKFTSPKKAIEFLGSVIEKNSQQYIAKVLQLKDY